MINAQPQYFFDHSGRELVSLPVKGTDDRVVTEAALWRNAVRRYGLSGRLYWTEDGKGYRYLAATVPGTGSHTTLARLLLGRPRGYRVTYVDGDRANLRPENLRLVAPWADDEFAAEALAIVLAQARELPEASHACA